MDGNEDRLSLAAELARRATDGAKPSNADLGELYQMNARTGQRLYTADAGTAGRPVGGRRKRHRMQKDAANAIKTDSVTGEPASIGGATTSFDNIVPQSGENATDGGRFCRLWRETRPKAAPGGTQKPIRPALYFRP
ncbi:MAG: hypothetical protein ACLUJ0_15580 [Ruthenibacterium lactatiformans]|uniref:hypothetical protein n=1 Tax=Ruthenibacterium lactatiformans TaxID=1550024 RepID=UPI0039937DA8